MEKLKGHRPAVPACWVTHLQRRLKELDWSLADLNREMGGDQHMYDLIRKYVKGEVTNPRGDKLERIAEALKMTPQELVYGHDTKQQPEQRPMETSQISPHGAEVSDGTGIDIGSAPDQIAKAFRALSINRKAEAWRLTSDAVAGEGYMPGDVLIVDLAARPAPGNVVLAMLSDRVSQAVFRLIEPPYLLAASLHRKHRKPILIDNDRVTIRGVVVGSLRLLPPPLGQPSSPSQSCE